MRDGIRAHNLSAEKYVLSAMLSYPELMKPIRGVLGEDFDAFYGAFHQQIYLAAISLADSNQPEITMSSMLALLDTEKTHKTKEEHEEYLYELMDSGLKNIPRAKHEAQVVLDLAELRRLDQDLRDIVNMNLSVDADLAATYDRLKELLEKRQQRSPAEVYTVSEAALAYSQYIKNMKKERIRFGWGEIDNATRGLLPGEVCLILARSGVGKSALAQSLQLGVWERQRIRSVFFSMEMPISAVYERIASMATGWLETRVEDAYLNGNGEAIKALGEYLSGLYYVEKAGLSLDDISAITMGLDDIGMIVIDYMGLVRAKGRTDYERTSAVARELKTLAKETQTAVVCICQTSRAAGDGTIPVAVHMGRDSGAIEEGADVILGMHRDEQDGQILHLAVLKARRGRAGTMIEMGFWKDTPKIVAVADMAGGES